MRTHGTAEESDIVTDRTPADFPGHQ